MTIENGRLDRWPSKHDLVEVPRSGASTFQTLKDYVDNILSPSIKGGAITGNGDGTFDVAGAQCFIRTTDDEYGELTAIDIPSATGLTATLGVVNWIYADFNGGTPQWVISTSFPNLHSELMLGRVFWDGTTDHVWQVGQDNADYMTVGCNKDFEVFGPTRASGMTIGASGTRNISITPGVLYCAHNRTTQPAFDSSLLTDRFTYIYRDGGGGWTKVASQAQINNTNYDDGDGTLGTLTPNRYGVHWVYETFDGYVYVQYGQGDYTLTQAQTDQPPTTSPFLQSFAILIGKIIIQASASAFTSIQSAFVQDFTPSTASDHNDLGGLQGGVANEYYHLSNAQLTGLTAGTIICDAPSELHRHSIDKSAIDPVAGLYSGRLYIQSADKILKFYDGTWYRPDMLALHQDIAGEVSGLTEKVTPIDADVVMIEDSADTDKKKKVSWTNIKATLKTYFDTIYTTITGIATEGFVKAVDATDTGIADTRARTIETNYTNGGLTQSFGITFASAPNVQITIEDLGAVSGIRGFMPFITSVSTTQVVLTVYKMYAVGANVYIAECATDDCKVHIRAERDV